VKIKRKLFKKAKLDVFLFGLAQVLLQLSLSAGQPSLQNSGTSLGGASFTKSREVAPV
jgi:hypothetical protein